MQKPKQPEKFAKEWKPPLPFGMNIPEGVAVILWSDGKGNVNMCCQPICEQTAKVLNHIPSNR